MKQIGRIWNFQDNQKASKEWQRGNGTSVLRAKELLNDPFLLLMSDHIFDSRIVKGLLNHQMKCAVV